MVKLNHHNRRSASTFTLIAAITALPAAASAHAATAADTWVLRGTKVYVAPDRAPIVDGVVVVRGSKIAAVGTKESVKIPSGARESSCSGGIVTAGFQNSHVHFIGETWNAAGTQPAAELSKKLANMLTRYGYATVFDIASDRDNTLAMRARIVRGEVQGPRIMTAGLPIFPHKGLPAYIDHLPRDFIDRMPQPANAEDAVKVVRENISAGAEATKLFLVTPQGRGVVKRMPADIARAAADETHRRGGLVFAHPTDMEGVEQSLAAGVDILAHTTHGVETPWPDALQKKAVGSGMTLIPTLKLMGYELKKEDVPPDIAARLIAASVAHTRAYAQAGGQILFGTDVGYMSDFDPTEEYVLMAKAGMTPAQILASLTTTPAARWKESQRRGTVTANLDADLTVLDADPFTDAANFSKARCTISGGKTVYPLADAR
jgi:imidazolonepropionase-like amidohydrolase